MSRGRKRPASLAAPLLALLLCSYAHAQEMHATPQSRGVYRLPFADGTVIKVFDDFLTHRPPGRNDLYAIRGTRPYRVVAAAAGRIVAIQDGYSRQQSGRAAALCHNNYVWIEHPNGEWTNYSHIAYHSATMKAHIRVGEEVAAGQYIGDEGEVGCAMLKHVHFEVAVPDPSHPIDRGGFLTDNQDGKRELNPRFCGVPGWNAIKGKVYVGIACSKRTLAKSAGSRPVTTRISCPAAAMPPGFHSGVAHVNGVAIHYVVGGHGPPMLLIHGWPETWYAWHQMMPRLAHNHTVVAVDYRGAGESSIPNGGYDKQSMAEDLDRLMVRLGHTRGVTLVGHDWGVPIAYAYAAAHRDAVDRLVAIDGVVEGPWTTNTEPFWFFGFQAIPDFAEKVLAGHYAEYLDWFYRNKAFHPAPMDSAEVAMYECDFSRPGRMRAGFDLYRTVQRDIAETAVSSRTSLTIPVLAVGAQYGVDGGVAATLKHVAANVTPVVMLDTGHFIPDERPDALVGLIEDFVAGRRIPSIWRPGAGK